MNMKTLARQLEENDITLVAQGYSAVLRFGTDRVSGGVHL